MNVSATTQMCATQICAAQMCAGKVERTVAAVEILTGYESSVADGDEVFIMDTYESAPDIEYYNNYSKEGTTYAGASGEQVFQAETPTGSGASGASETSQVGHIGDGGDAKSNGAPDINAYHRWECPLYKEMMNTLDKIFRRRAAEAKATPWPEWYISQRYYNPNAPHYVGHDMTPEEKHEAFMLEYGMMVNGREITGASTLNPIFEGRGLGRSVPSNRSFAPYNAQRQSAGWTFHNRGMITSQLGDLFKRNGISIPENLRLSFIIDSQHHLRVTGTDDENLIKKLEELLNSNGNAYQLHKHIMQSSRTVGGDRYSSQIQDDSLRMYQVDWKIREYTGYERKDLELVNGKFLTKDGVDIAELIKKGVAGHFHDSPSDAGLLMMYTLQEIEWLATVGPENIPEMILAIDFENGNLYDVGQPYGYGLGQTDWLRSLLGGKDPHDSNSWL